MTLIYSLQGSYTYMGAFLLLHFDRKGRLRTFGGLIVSLQLPEAQLTCNQPDTSPDNQKPYLQVRKRMTLLLSSPVALRCGVNGRSGST
ncbi:Uncharacterized protein HZ326_8594 [Fusarium oxysporum f. sp. albedinis]|nr:Uncharacterized protein HZ326_8594 [Fusarium oxysporum f. sp. albedinis]